MAYTFPVLDSYENARRNSTKIAVYFLPYGQDLNQLAGIHVGASPTVQKFGGVLCVLNDMSDIAFTPIGEQVVMRPGKRKNTVRDSTGMNFTMNLDGNSGGTLMAMLGMNPSDNEAMELGQDFGMVGALIIQSWKPDKTPARSTLILDVKLRVPSIVGVPNDGDSFQALEFYQDEQQVYDLWGTDYWTWSGFYENTGPTIVNADAPDGILTAFILDNCNNSVTATPPVPLKVFPTARFPQRTTHQEYLALLMVNERLIPASEATFATSTITFTTAPLINTTLLAIYAITSSLVDPMGGSGTACRNERWEPFMGVM